MKGSRSSPRERPLVTLTLCGAMWLWIGAPALRADSSFRRGDANQDVRIDLSDAVCVLSFLFAGEGSCSAPSCLDALDADDDETVNITDGVFLLAFLFSGGTDLPSPFFSCGPDLSHGEEQRIDCASYTGCEDVTMPTFSAPEECGVCHPRQYGEWLGSMHSYAGQSPLFNALEIAGNLVSDNSLRPGGASGLFCIKCHNAVGTAMGDIPPPGPDGSVHPSIEHATPLTGQGIQCDVCHFVRRPHPEVTRFQREADGERAGVANAAFRLEAGVTRFGPLNDPVANEAHLSAPGEGDIFRRGDFCGMCHDVRIPGHNEEAEEPFLRLENLFTEWENSPYNDPRDPRNVFGRTIACQDCHMSLFPYSYPGAFPSGRVAETAGQGFEPPPVRDRVTTHFFTAVDKTLIPFPNQTGDQLDAHGNPASQDARRRHYLRLATTMSLDETERGIEVGAETVTLPVNVMVSNFLAGHNVPSGFSQERQIWIELEVRDGAGETLYRSGHLEDRPHPETGELEPDGRLADEDHLDKSLVFDLATGEATVTRGPDYDLRPAANRGLVSFQNEFLRRDDGGTPDDPSDDTEEEVFVPFLANAINNDVALKPFEPQRFTYDVEVPPGTPGPISVSARLLFRQFPPYFVRFLAGVLPDYVSEETADRLDIVEMSSASLTVAVNGVVEPEPVCVDYMEHIQPIWDARCMPCHSGESAMMGLDLRAEASYEALVTRSGVESFPKPVVDPANPHPDVGGSFLLDKLMSSTPRVANQMPAGGALPLSEHELLLILRWIEEGALPAADCPEG